MWETIEKAVSYAYFRPHQRKVERYLEEATIKSVLQDLGHVLESKAQEIRHLSAIFEAHCLTAGEDKFWTESSLNQYLETAHPEFSFPVYTIKLLWRCLHFHAFHPFPQEDDSHVSESAFRRAVILLSVQGTDLLGTQDGGDYFWLSDGDFFRDADFRRILRSISHVCARQEKQSATQPSSVVNDTMDVLATTQPFLVTLAPSPDSLKVTAQRLLGDASVGHQLRTKDLSALIALLLQLRVHRTTWSKNHRFGDFHRDSRCEDLSASITARIFNPDDFNFNASSRMLRVLPNFRIQFYHLWAALFQPARNKEALQLNSPVAVDTVPVSVLQALSLFTPPPLSPGQLRSWSKDEGIVFDVSLNESESAASNDLTKAHLVEALLNYPEHAHIVLFVDDAYSNVFGGYLPRSSSSKEFKVGPGHLFQLSPQLRLFRWTKQPILLTDLISEVDSRENPQNNTLGDTSRSAPYTIGDFNDNRDSASLLIDPRTKTIQLTSPVPGDTAKYKILCDSPTEQEKSNNNNNEMKKAAKIDSLCIFRTSTFGQEADAAFLRDIEAKYCPIPVQTDHLVRGPGLIARIQGFGSK